MRVAVVQRFQGLFADVRPDPVGVSDFHERGDAVDAFRYAAIRGLTRLRFTHVGQQSNIAFLKTEKNCLKIVS